MLQVKEPRLDKVGQYNHGQFTYLLIGAENCGVDLGRPLSPAQRRADNVANLMRKIVFLRELTVAAR